MENPVGLDGIEFVEYVGPNPEALRTVFKAFGFVKAGQHKTKKIELYRQGDITFVLNDEPSTFAADFKKLHGPSICSMGWRVKHPSEKSLRVAVERGAKPYAHDKPSFLSKKWPTMYGIGDSLIHFVDVYNSTKLYSEDFDLNIEKWNNVGKGFTLVDHLTNNVPAGDMDKWCDFYAKIFGFVQRRYFDIRGLKTGLQSKVMASIDNKIIIPINEPTESKSQIQEYLDEYKGSGVQHLALLAPNIIESVTLVQKEGVEFLDVPPTYYELLPKRGFKVREPISKLKELSLLADGDEEGYLLQIFTKNLIGPIFFEVIQRHNHWGFGEGNFQALFDSIERDQIKRGYLKE